MDDLKPTADGDKVVNNAEVKIKLESNEGGVFDCLLSAAKMSVLISGMLEALDKEVDHSKAIPLKNDAVTDEALKKIIEYLEYHWDDPEPDEDFEEEKDRKSDELGHWDKQFIDVSDQGHLFDILVSANFMDIKGLVEVAAKHICSKIKGKSPQEVREILKIKNDLSAEEVAAIEKENEWIYAKD